VSIDPARRSALLGVKLAALVREHAGDAPAMPGALTGGAALVRPDGVWVLADSEPKRGLGIALAWALRNGGVSNGLNIVVDTIEHAAIIARRAEAFVPKVRAFAAQGRDLKEASPSPHEPSPSVDPRLVALADDIVASQAEVVVERGVLAGEVRGLEVCRAVLDPYLDVTRLEVGVGVHDREAFQLLHGDRPAATALREIVAKAQQLRAPGADPHPLNRLAGERALRADAIAAPSTVGASWLRPADPPVARANLKDPVPCVATGEQGNGEKLTVVFSSGIDLDLVPFSADARLLHGGKLVVVVPRRDAPDITRELLGLLCEPADLITVD
jgi:hypothetical protein